MPTAPLTHPPYGLAGTLSLGRGMFSTEQDSHPFRANSVAPTPFSPTTRTAPQRLLPWPLASRLNSAICNLQSAITPPPPLAVCCTPEIRNPQSAIRNLQFELPFWQSRPVWAFTPHSELRTPHWAPPLVIVRRSLPTPNSALRAEPPPLPAIAFGEGGSPPIPPLLVRSPQTALCALRVLCG